MGLTLKVFYCSTYVRSLIANIDQGGGGWVSIELVKRFFCPLTCYLLLLLVFVFVLFVVALLLCCFFVAIALLLVLCCAFAPRHKKRTAI
jgi:hypothetical protein